MTKTPFFSSVFFVIICIAFLHFIGIHFYFYWTLWWFDIVLHFLGGFWVALVALWFSFFSGYLKRYGPTYTLLTLAGTALISALATGIAWEIFEFWSGITFTSSNYITDTLLDLVMDSIGGFSAFIYVSRNSKSIVGQEKMQIQI